MKMNINNYFKLALSLKSLLLASFLCFIISINLDAAEKTSMEKISPQKTWVSVPVLNVRSAPDLNTDIVDKLEYGTIVDVLKFENNWKLVRINDSEGWIYAPLTENTYEARINADSVKLREEKNVYADVNFTLRKEQQVLVLTEQSDWAYVATPENQKGWLFSAHINRGSRKAWVNAETLNVRTKASLNSMVIGKVNQGDEIYVIQEQGEWSEISNDKISGWVANAFLSEESINTPPTFTTDLKTRSEYLKEHPNLPFVIKETIKNGSFKLGMTKQQVLASLGEPDRVIAEPINSAASEQWIYSNGAMKTFLNFQNDYLASWGKDYPIAGK